MSSGNEETWKPVAGFEGVYEVSDQGRVRRVSTDHVLKTSYCGGGSKHRRYGMVTLCNGDRIEKRKVHLMVLEAFVGPRPEGQLGLHRDGDTRNNALENLHWGLWVDVSRGRVARGAHFGGVLTNEQRLEIRRRRRAGERGAALAREFGVSQATVWGIYVGRIGGYLDGTVYTGK